MPQIAKAFPRMALSSDKRPMAGIFDFSAAESGTLAWTLLNNRRALKRAPP
jgi:hypothetical protein